MQYGRATLNKLWVISKAASVPVTKADKRAQTSDAAKRKIKKRKKDALVSDDEEMTNERESDDELGEQESRSIKKTKGKD